MNEGRQSRQDYLKVTYNKEDRPDLMSEKNSKLFKTREIGVLSLDLQEYPLLTMVLERVKLE